MSPLSKEQFNQIRDERKEQIIDAALKVFSRYGFVGTTIKMITSEARVSQGLFHHYFKSKDELFNSLLKEAIEASLSGLDMLNKVPGTPKDKIKLLTESILDERGAPFFRLIHRVRNSNDIPVEAKQIINQHPRKEYVDRLQPLFREGQLANVIVEGNTEELISNYLSILSGLMLLGEGYLIPDTNTLLRLVLKNPE